MKKCPYCAEEIQDEAIICKFCQFDLTNGLPIKHENTKKKDSRSAKEDWISAIIAFLIPTFFCYLYPITFGQGWSKYWIQQVFWLLCLSIGYVIPPMILVTIIFFIFRQSFKKSFLIALILLGVAMSDNLNQWFIVERQWVMNIWILTGMYMYSVWVIKNKIKNYLSYKLDNEEYMKTKDEGKRMAEMEDSGKIILACGCEKIKQDGDWILCVSKECSANPPHSQSSLSQDKKAPKTVEDSFYEAVGKEIANGDYKLDMQTKAIAKSKGDKNLEKSLYVEFRVDQLKEERAVEKERVARAAACKSHMTEQEIKDEALRKWVESQYWGNGYQK